MRLSVRLMLAFVAFVAVLAVTCSAKTTTRSELKLPKLFDFELFKQLFKKSYRSSVEELSRRRLFLARAFRVFVSGVGYKYRRNPAYLAINERSDWTAEERARSFMRPPAQVEAEPLVDLEDIEEELAEISSHSHGRPVLEQIAQELRSSSRRKRDTSNSPRDLSLGQLIAAPVEEDEEPVKLRVPTNNPNYQRPELSSMAPSSGPKAAAPVGELKNAAGFKPKAFLEAEVEKELSKFSAVNAGNNKQDVVYVDHRDSNCFFRPRDQGECGSCYAFASVALYEYHYCKEMGEKIAFSEQYIVDCGRQAGELDGCDGGYFEDMSKFVKMFGMELRADYPYRGQEDTCPYESDTPFSARGYIRLHDGGFEAFNPKELEQRLAETPILMAIHVDTDTFSDYRGGVDSPRYCRAGNGRDALHAVLFVGHGREDGQEYWLIRNSYGPSWGLGGYYKMNKKSKQCLDVYEEYYQLKDFSVPRTTRPRDTSQEVKRRRQEYDGNKNKKKRATR